MRLKAYLPYQRNCENRSVGISNRMLCKSHRKFGVCANARGSWQIRKDLTPILLMNFFFFPTSRVSIIDTKKRIYKFMLNQCMLGQNFIIGFDSFLVSYRYITLYPNSRRIKVENQVITNFHMTILAVNDKRLDLICRVCTTENHFSFLREGLRLLLISYQPFLSSWTSSPLQVRFKSASTCLAIDQMWENLLSILLIALCLLCNSQRRRLQLLTAWKSATTPKRSFVNGNKKEKSWYFRRRQR